MYGGGATMGGYGHAMANANIGMQMAGMQMGGLMNGGMFNNMFLYSGNPIGLQSRLEGLDHTQASTIRQATINCTGAQISEMSMCCLFCTIIWGSILIFPLCFMCCDWWMRIAYASFEVPESTYRALQNLVCNSSLQTFTMTVTDNRLNATKAQILYDLLSRSQIKGFTLINLAGNFDLDSNQYSNFVQNFRILKKLPLYSEIKWSRKLVV